MDNLDKVEKLRERADISYDEARAVLEECEWDLHDAVIKLEEQGKISSEGRGEYSTKVGSSDSPKNPQELAESYNSYNENRKNEKSFFKTFSDGVKYIARKGCENEFIVKKHGRQMFSIPVLLFAILIIAFFWCILILMLIGLFFGFSYNFSGPDLGKKSVNDAMNKATEAAENIKTEIKNSSEEKDEEKNTDN